MTTDAVGTGIPAGGLDARATDYLTLTITGVDDSGIAHADAAVEFASLEVEGEDRALDPGGYETSVMLFPDGSFESASFGFGLAGPISGVTGLIDAGGVAPFLPTASEPIDGAFEEVPSGPFAAMGSDPRLVGTIDRTGEEVSIESRFTMAGGETVTAAPDGSGDSYYAELGDFAEDVSAVVKDGGLDRLETRSDEPVSLTIVVRGPDGSESSRISGSGIASAIWERQE